MLWRTWACWSCVYPVSRVSVIGGSAVKQNCFAFGEVLFKRTKNNQKCLLLVLFLLLRDNPPPAMLRGPAPNGHPCPDGALAASMPLDPLRIACVWPAPKSRSVVSGLSR